MIYSGTYNSPIGEIYIVCSNEAVLGLWFYGQKHFAVGLTKTPIPNENHKLIIDVKHWLDRYFIGEKPAINELKLNPQGTEFQKLVWKLLKEIPYGKTITYGSLAESLDKNMSAQAIGNAVGRNPISVIIPCHRVIGANGKLTGYAGGIAKKEFLMKLESNID